MSINEKTQGLERALFGLSVGLDMGAEVQEHVFRVRDLCLEVRACFSDHERDKYARSIMLLVHSALTFTEISALTSEMVLELGRVLEVFSRGERDRSAFERARSTLRGVGMNVDVFFKNE